MLNAFPEGLASYEAKLCMSSSPLFFLALFPSFRHERGLASHDAKLFPEGLFFLQKLPNENRKSYRLCIVFAQKKEPHVRLDDLRGCIPDAIAISSKVQILLFESALWAYC